MCTGCASASLADAVAAARDGDTIRLCPGAFHTVNVAINKDLTIVGAGAGRTTLDAEGDGQVLSITEGAEVAIRDLTITWGNAAIGGGIGNRGTLTLEDTLVTGNTATFRGGGILNDAGTLTLNDSSVTGNTAGVHGGGIFNSPSGTVSVNGGSVTGNFAPAGTPNNCAPVGSVAGCVGLARPDGRLTRLTASG